MLYRLAMFVHTFHYWLLSISFWFETIIQQWIIFIMACHINYDLNILSDFATVNHTAYVLLWAPNCLLIPSFMEFRQRIFKECHNMTNTHKRGSPQISSGAFKIHLVWNILLHILSIWQYFCRINGMSSKISIILQSFEQLRFI